MIHNDSTPILRHPRTLGLIAFAVCTGLLGTAFYMEYVVSRALPTVHGSAGRLCPVWIDRADCRTHATDRSSGSRICHRRHAGRRFWFVSGWPPTVAAIAAADQVPDCAPGIYYMIDTFPFAEVVQTMLMGSVTAPRCSGAGWAYRFPAGRRWLLASWLCWPPARPLVRYRPRLFR